VYCADVDLEYAPEGTSFQAALTMIEEVITASSAAAPTAAPATVDK
jgi:hypothetical protein